jgi:hypothetical protein
LTNNDFTSEQRQKYGEVHGWANRQFVNNDEIDHGDIQISTIDSDEEE